MTWKPLVIIAGLSLAACSTQSQMSTILAMESALTAADEAALGYLALPPCSATSGAVCRNATVATQIKLAAQDAHDTIKAAEAKAQSGATVDLTASTAAMQALQSVLSNIPKS